MDIITRTENDMPETMTEGSIRDYAHRIQVRLGEMGEAITALRLSLEPVLNPNTCPMGAELSDAQVARAPMVEQLDAIHATLTEQMWEIQEIHRWIVL